MNDDVKAAVEWLRKYTKAQRDGLAVVMKLPADYAEYILAHLDGEPARIAAAVAAAREEQREACTQYLRDYARDLDEELRYSSRATRAYFEQVVATGEAADRCRYAPLDATPLADRIAELERRMTLVLHAGPSTSLAVSVFDRAEKAEARVRELEAQMRRPAWVRVGELERQCWDESQRAEKAEAERAALAGVRKSFADEVAALSAEAHALRARVAELDALLLAAHHTAREAKSSRDWHAAQVERVRKVATPYEKPSYAEVPAEYVEGYNDAVRDVLDALKGDQ